MTQLRVLSAQLSSVSNDAVREITQQTEASLSRLVRIEIALGLLSVLAALALGLLLRRAGAEQAAQFRSLVNNSSDLITVLAPDGTIAYQSPSVQRVLGRRPADLVGTALGDLVHPDDQDDVNVSLTKLVEAAGSDRQLRVPAAARRRVVASRGEHLHQPRRRSPRQRAGAEHPRRHRAGGVAHRASATCSTTLPDAARDWSTGSSS